MLPTFPPFQFSILIRVLFRSNSSLSNLGFFFNSIQFNSFLFQAELRASVFEAIEEEDRVIEKDQALPPALLGSCNDRAKQLHASPSGQYQYSTHFLFICSMIFANSLSVPNHNII